MENNFKTQGGLIISSTGAGNNTHDLLVRDSTGLVKTITNNFYIQSEIQDFFDGTSSITGYNKSNWDTAFSWGDHSGLYSLLGHTHNYENPLTFASTGAASVSRTGDTITIGATNTTYSNMSLGELTTGTSTTARSISASTLRSWGDGRYLTSMPSHNHDGDYLPINGQDNEVTVININEADLPADYTKADVVAHLNTLGVSKDDIETIVVNIDDTTQFTIDWGSVTGKPSTYPAAPHNHDSDYLQLTGGTLSGDLNLNLNNLVFSDNGGTNYDHIWYDDGTFGGKPGQYHFVSDAAPQATGNSAVRAGSFYNTAGTEVAYTNDSRINNGQTAYGWGDHSTQGYLTSMPSHNHDSDYLQLTGGTLSGDLTFTPGAAGVAIAGVFGANTTQKSYINFTAASGSNDPGYIMHETSGAQTNNGVIHIAPTDDNSRNDYVTIHGTNDPEILKLHTDGYIEALGGNSANWNTAYGWGNHASAGYLTSYSETDTLDSVTSRGNTTTNDITVGYTNLNGGANFLNGNTNFRIYNNAGNDVLYLRDTTNASMLMTYGVGYVTSNVAFFADNGATVTGAVTATSIVKSGASSSDILLGDGTTTSTSTFATSSHTHSNYLDKSGGTMTGDITLGTGADVLVSGNRYAFRYSSDQNYGLFFNSTAQNYEFRGAAASVKASISASSGLITASGGNSSNWNTAYGWGDHATAGYASSSHNHDSDYLQLTGGTLTGNLGLSKGWDTGTISNNSIYVGDVGGGFAFGVGTSLSTWFAYDGTVRRGIDVHNNGSEIELYFPTTVDTLQGVNYVNGAGGNIAKSVDGWLRLNDGQGHGSGIYCGTSTVRTDGRFQIGSGGGTFEVSSTNFSYKNEVIPTSKGAGANAVTGLWQGTQAEYDAIPTKDAYTIYFIK
jgi:hypothetical protein